MSSKKMFSIGSKLTILIVFMALTISFAAIFSGYFTYRNALQEQYITLGSNLAKTATNYVDGDSIAGYVDTLTADESYDKTLEMLRVLKNNNDILYLYVVQPTQIGTYYIFDTDESEDRMELGGFEEWYTEFEDPSKDFLAGNAIQPVISNDAYGWLLSVYEPIYGSDNTVKGYVGADFSMDKHTKNLRGFLLLLIVVTSTITVLFALIYLYFIRRFIVSPINRISRAADDYLVEKPTDAKHNITTTSITDLQVNSKDELGSLAVSLKSLETKINEYIFELEVATKKSQTDPMTKLDNRETLMHKVNILLHAQQEFDEIDAFFIIDVDYFKSINDTYGHVIGDEVLMKCAAALKSLFRGADVVSRMGGDEFAVFCKNVGSLEMVNEKAEAICAKWRNIYPTADSKHATASVGIALSPQHGTTYIDLYLNADQALYKSKEQGRNQYTIFE